jgi:hypothetical protein
MNNISYSWFNEEKTVLLCTYDQGEWTWNDFHEAFLIQNEMIDSVDYPKIHIIVDTRASSWLPRGGSLLSGARKLTSLKHPRQGHTIVVGAQGMVAAVVRTVTKILGAHQQEIHLVDTMEEAESLVSELMENAKTS